MLSETIRNDLIKLIKHDIRQGIICNWLKYVLAFFMVIFPLLILWKMCSNENITPSFIDYIIYIFKGMEIYVPSPTSTFKIPVIYLMFNIYIAFLVGNYPLNDLTGTAQNILLRTKNRLSWWLSKCIWNMGSVIVFYIVIFFTCFIFTLFTGTLSLTPTNELHSYFGVNFSNVDEMRLVFTVAVLPLLTSIAVSLAQMALAFMMKPVNSYIIVVSFFVASAYFFSFLLIGNYPMLMRNSLVIDNGIDTYRAVFVCIGVALVSAAAGYARFRKMDILDKSNN